MWHSLEKCIFLLILMKIGLLQSAPIADRCSCPKIIPPVHVPDPPPPVNVPCPTHGYKIEIPPPVLKTATLSYAMDVVVEAPLPVVPPTVCDPNIPPDSEPCDDDFGGVAALKGQLPAKTKYQIIAPPPADPPAPLPAAYSLHLLPPAKPCVCGKPIKPVCRYVLDGIKSNRIYRERTKREVSSKKHQFIKSKPKAKKSKIVKRDIKGEYDLLQREQSEMDLTIPEIIQYMPETMMANFKRGQCNIGCKNCIHKDSKEQFEQLNTKQPTETINNENDKPSEQQPTKALNENITESPTQRLDMSPTSAVGENYYDKRSVNPIENPNPNPSHSGLLPPPYISSTMELTKHAKNPVNPIWYEPQSWTDPNNEYVYDRLGHKYKMKNGSFQLMKPDQNDEEVNRSAHVASVENEEDKPDETKAVESSAKNTSDDEELLDAKAQKLYDSAIQHQGFSDTKSEPVAINEEKIIQNPTVGAPAHRNPPSYDHHMDKVIRDIIYKHPDFVDATQHAPGSLTLPDEVARDETMEFLDKLIRGRFNKWFGSPRDQVSMYNLQDLNRYSRETGRTIKFIPIVTVDKDRLDTYHRHKQSEETA